MLNLAKYLGVITVNIPVSEPESIVNFGILLGREDLQVDSTKLYKVGDVDTLFIQARPND